MSPDELAIFPLSNVVLFPGIQTPLHLFEPRYRQMAEQVLAAERRIGMVVVPPEHAHAMGGDPPVYPIGCAGDVARAQRLPDGRFNIVLSGAWRFRVTHEAPRPAERLFRVAEVERLEDPYPEAAHDEVAALRERIVDRVRTLVERSEPGRGDRVSRELVSGVDVATFVNSLCNALAFAPAEKQGLLEAASVPERFERLDGLLEFRLADPGRSAGGSQTLH